MKSFFELGYLIKVINDNLLRIINRYMSDYDLTFQQFQIIEYIMQQEKDVSQKEIENYLNVAHPTVVGLLKRMEMKNFIVCRTNSQNKRIKNVFLTNQAFDIMKKFSQQKKLMEEELLNGITGSQKDELIKSLQIVFKNIHNKQEVNYD